MEIAENMSTAPEHHPAGDAPAAFKTESPSEAVLNAQNAAQPDAHVASAPSGSANAGATTDATTHNTGNAATTVLVTGGNGYLASHLILQLLLAGYTVRTTVGDSSPTAADLRKCLMRALETAGIKGQDVEDHLERLSFYPAILSSDDGWADAVRGCKYVHSIIGEATTAKMVTAAARRDRFVRVLKAAHEAVVERVILTSSFATIGYGHPADKARVFTETDWSVDNGSLSDAHYSFLQAEKAVWEYVQSLPVGSGRGGNKLQLTVINPVGILGPALPGLGFFSQSTLSSAPPTPESAPAIIGHLLDGSLAVIPSDADVSIVDVRDVANLQIKAMTASDSVASGQRFLAAADAARPTQLSGVALTIRKERPRPAKARKMPAAAPNWVAKVAKIVTNGSKEHLAQMLEFDAGRLINNARAREQLGWQPRPVHETILETVDSLAEEQPGDA